MIRFNCDYTEGAHKRILEKLIETNDNQTDTYGNDIHCKKAAEYIRNLCKLDENETEVHFFSGGTQTNLTVISSLLRPYQGVISADTGHINTHETGAIEATGHAILPIKTNDGKIKASELHSLCKGHFEDENREHCVQPGMVYISHPTESGTSYTKSEVEAIRKVCDEFKLPLFLDGARLGYALVAEGTDLKIEDIANLCDVFYIGGTKVGALFGEALVITNKKLFKDFRYMIKRSGAMLAKGRMLGLQFEALFEDGLYFEISKHAVSEADRIRKAMADLGCKFLFETSANQLFPIMKNDVMLKMQEKFAFFKWESVNETESAVRICTSWCTKPENTDAFIAEYKKYC